MGKKTKKKKKGWERERDCGDCNLAFERESKMQIVSPTMKDFYFLTLGHRISRKISIPFTFLFYISPMSFSFSPQSTMLQIQHLHTGGDRFLCKETRLFFSLFRCKTKPWRKLKTRLLCSTFKIHTSQEIINNNTLTLQPCILRLNQTTHTKPHSHLKNEKRHG